MINISDIIKLNIVLRVMSKKKMKEKASIEKYQIKCANVRIDVYIMIQEMSKWCKLGISFIL